MKIRNNLGSFYTTLSGGGPTGGFYNQNKVGRVVHVISSRRSAGYEDDSDIGSVYIIDHKAPGPNIPLSGRIPLSKNQLLEAGLKKVKPLFPQFTYVPLIGELVLLFSLPSFDSTKIQGATEVYYLNSIDLFLNSHHNSQGVYNTVDSNDTIKLGDYAKESTDVANLLPIEGDFILNSRWGSGIRFSHSPPFNTLVPPNPWIDGTPNSPITLIVNGYTITDENRTSPHIENINDDASSLYLTSTQYINNFLPNSFIEKKPDNFIPALVSPFQYGGKSQAILSANRITLSSNKDDIVLYAATNIEMGANNTIHLNSRENIYLNSSKVYLGSIKDNNLGNVEPVLLGYKTKEVINEILSVLINLTENLNSLKAVDPKGMPLAISVYSGQANEKLNYITKKIAVILSDKTYTS